MQIDVETCRLSEVMTRRYRLISMLGQGGMGRVFLCEGAEGRVAVKVTRLIQGEDSQALRQFRQEASILKGVSHPGLVGVLDYIEEESHGYLVMDYHPGKTLAQKVQDEGPAGVAAALHWGQQLCEVLDFLHRQNPVILFRDLKPSNVMVDDQNRVKLIDFGIARTQVTGVMTATFLQGVGSAGYAPIEQYQGAGSTDPRSDIYSLGATLFHVLTGRTPPSPIDVVADDSQVPSARFLNPNVPPWLDSVLRKMMATRKENRFQSAAEAGLALRRMLTVEDEPTESLAPARPRADQLLYGLTGVLTSVALGLMGWLFVSSQSAPSVAPTAAVSPPAVVAAAAAPASVSPPAPEMETTRTLPAPVAPPPPKKAPVVAVKVAPPPQVTPSPVLPAAAYPTRTLVHAKKVEEKAAEAAAPTPIVYQVIDTGQPDLSDLKIPTPTPSPSETPPPPIYQTSLPPHGRESGPGQGYNGPAPGGPMMGGGHGGFGGPGGGR